MIDELKTMVNRFLAWKLPADFYPDCHIHFDREKAEKLGPQLWPSGTNLLNANQAEAMIQHVAEPLTADLATLRATIERMSQTALIDTQQIAALNAQVATLTADVAAERLERESHADDAIRLHREKCDCILREMALTAERDKLRTSMDQLRRSCANIIGADEEAWPDHGNAPLAIAACLGLRSAELVQATAERDRYRAALECIADPHWLKTHGDPAVLRTHARAALQEPK